MNEAKPAKNASEIRPATSSGLEARELFVDAPLEVRVERRSDRRRRCARAAPVPRCSAEHDGAAEHSYQRQQPRQQVEAVRRWAGDDGRPERRDQLVLDLRACVAGVDAPCDERLHAESDRRARLVERRVTSRADDLAFELALRRTPLARRRRRGAQEQRSERYEESASWMHCCSVSFVTAPGTCATTRPLRSAQNVSGTPVSPYLVYSLSPLSMTLG